MLPAVRLLDQRRVMDATSRALSRGRGIHDMPVHTLVRRIRGVAGAPGVLGPQHLWPHSGHGTERMSVFSVIKGLAPCSDLGKGGEDGGRRDPHSMPARCRSVGRSVGIARSTNGLDKGMRPLAGTDRRAKLPENTRGALRGQASDLRNV